MVDHRIHRALTGAGVLLLLLYGAGWAWAIHAERSTASVPEPEPVAEPANDDRVYYRVRLPDGRTDVFDVSKLDAAEAVLTASKRFGEGASLERIDHAEAVLGGHTRAIVEAKLPRSLWFAPVLLLPVWFLLVGARVRALFQRLDAVVSQLRVDLRARADEVMEAARATPAELRAILARVNARLGTEFVWDERRGWIVDARLSHFSLVLRYCPRCNTPIAARIRADMLEVPTCTTCMATFEGQELDHQRAQIVDRLLNDRTAADQDDRPGFSPITFALWAALLPPVAVIYAQGAAR